MRKLFYVLILFVFTTQVKAQITGGGRNTTNNTQKNNNNSDDDEYGDRSYFFWGYGVSDPWVSNDLEGVSKIAPITMGWAFGINDQMSWGMGFHLGYVEANYNYAFSSEYVSYLHWSVNGQYYYHFLPRTSRFDLAGVASIGYAKVSMTEEESLDYYNGEGIPSSGIKLGISGLAKVRLGRRFGFYAKAGYDPMAGHIQVGMAWGR